ncbi:SpoIID/LytB domain-containing protein [Lederbergia citri]|uniref:SpoIID/LytB domain-containing protein n=1 Tax=Lederbergia citri TaxID=2833580 RepID=A0A942TG31_9BACI|nr:SpoIID/LytB domain-containing protein [Lederbergia citri]MBS4195729.1 SpoIID/LytB domain-containing protein [Lederbergia citri]
MNSNKLLLALIPVLLICLLSTNVTEAYTTVPYQNEVKVQLSNTRSTSIPLRGIYELQDKASSTRALLAPNVIISVSASGSSTIIKAGDVTYTSPAGFFLRETTGLKKIAKFTSNTNIHSGATKDYEIKKTISKVEVAEYITSIVNNKNETWYNVQTADGTKGWVPAASTLIEDSPSIIYNFTLGTSSYRGSILLEASNSNVKVINILDLENYVKGVVPNEMPSSWHIEALKAQAIAARSYAANSMLLQNTTASQVYKGYSSEQSKSNQAVDETKGLLVKYNGKPIQTFFYSTSGGKTANIGDVWNSNQATYPYLKSVSDPYENSPHSNWEEKISSATILSGFGFNPLTTNLYDIKVQATGANGEISSVSIETSEGNKTVKGNENDIRKLFPVGGAYNMLKSNWFTLTSTKDYSIQMTDKVTSQYNIKGQSILLADNKSAVISSNLVDIQMKASTLSKESDPASILIKGKGWGHRIGMSQYGAKGLAENGWKAENIIKHYFQGTTVEY